MTTRYELKDFQFIADKLSGKLDSTDFSNYESKLDWECNLGHKFSKAPSIIINRLTWCTKCKRGIHKESIKEIVKKLKEERRNSKSNGDYSEEESKLFFVEFQKSLNEKMAGAVLLDDNVFNGNDKFYGVLCPINHKIKLTYNQVINDTARCKSCIQIPEDSIKEFERIIEQKKGTIPKIVNGKENRYINDKTKLWVQCESNHKWKVTPNNIKGAQSWCPHCTIPVNEERCRVILNYLLDSNLEKVRPDFLNYKETGRNLELDGYDKKQQIAFEYNGIHHYEEMYFDSDKERLSYQQRKDIFKQEKCKELGIVLLIISYEYVKIKKDSEVIKYLVKLLKEKSIEIDSTKVDELLVQNISTLMPYHTRASMHKEFAIKECSRRGGTIVDINNISIDTNRTLFKVICSFNHKFDTNVENLKDKRGRWCVKCKTNMVIDKAALANVHDLLKEYVQIVNIERSTICEVFCLNCGKIHKDVSFADIRQHCDQKESYELEVYDCEELEGFKVINFEITNDYKYVICPRCHIHKVEISKINKFKCRECYFKREKDHLKRINFSLIGKSDKSDAVIIKCNVCSYETKTYRSQIPDIQECRLWRRHT